MKRTATLLILSALTATVLASCALSEAERSPAAASGGQGGSASTASAPLSDLASNSAMPVKTTRVPVTTEPMTPPTEPKTEISLIPDFFGQIERDYTGTEMKFDYDMPVERVDCMFDGNPETKYCYWAPDITGKPIVWSMTGSFTVTRYSLTTANDNEEWNGRNPIGWSLYGTNELSANDPNDESWTLLARVEGAQIPDENYKTFDFEIDNQGSYRYFMLIFDELNESIPGLVSSGEYDEFGELILVEGQQRMLMQLSEFSLYGWAD